MTETHTTPTLSRAARIIARCRELARVTDVPGETTRLYLSPATRNAHTLLSWWMRQAGLYSLTDDIGNLRAVRYASVPDAPTFVIFSHIDTVPNAGAFDGPLGIVAGIGVLEELGNTPLPFNIELIAFAEEEGVRFSAPFLPAYAVTGHFDPETLGRKDANGVTFAQAVRDFGLDPDRIPVSCPLARNTFAALEIHIEQGPVLDEADASLAVVDTIVGQSRLSLVFQGRANHAGTTPMPLRHDALAAAAQWIVEVERFAAEHTQLVATVGRIEVHPGAANVVPGRAKLSLDLRHPKDESRHAAAALLLTKAEHAGNLRGVSVHATASAEQKAVPMDRALTLELQQAAARAGYDARTLFSGAGHDAMILAPHVPTTMLFVRSPGGQSHHPDETVREEDVEAAVATVLNFLLHLRP
jgi:allantoate deiminase